MPPQPEPVALPIFLALAGVRVLVVGGGAAAVAKIRMLRPTGAELAVVAEEPDAALECLAREGAIALRRRAFAAADLAGVRLCYVALNDAAETAAVVAQARRHGVLVNAVDRPALCDFTTPAIVDRGSITIAISTGGAAPALARELRARIEAAVPPAYGVLASFCRRWRERVARTIADRQRRRQLWDSILAGPEAAAVLDGDDAAAERLMTGRLARTIRGDVSARGRVSLVGAGPGDPDLLTLKALRILQHADIILHDRLVDARILALARREARRFDVDGCRGRQATSEAAIVQLILAHVRAGGHVVRLADGDPLASGRGAAELAALARIDDRCRRAHRIGRCGPGNGRT